MSGRLRPGRSKSPGGAVGSPYPPELRLSLQTPPPPPAVFARREHLALTESRADRFTRRVTAGSVTY